MTRNQYFYKVLILRGKNATPKTLSDNVTGKWMLANDYQDGVHLPHILYITLTDGEEG